MDNSTHVLEEGKILEFFEKLHRLTHPLDVLIGDLCLGDTVVRLSIAVILVIEYLYRGIVADLIAAHILNIKLYGTLAYHTVFTFVFGKCLCTGLDKGIYRPKA